MRGEIPDRFAHVLGAGRAVQTDDVDVERFQRGERAGDVRPEQHPSAGIERHLRLDRHAAAEVAEETLEAGDGRLHLEDVLRGLDEQDVHAAFDQRLRLRIVGVFERAKGDAGEDRVAARWQHAGGAD